MKDFDSDSVINRLTPTTPFGLYDAYKCLIIIALGYKKEHFVRLDEIIGERAPDTIY